MRTEAELSCLLGEGLDGGLQLVMTQNRVSLASVRFVSRGRAVLRLQEMFLSAPDDVIQALRRYLQTRKRTDWSVVSAFARARHVERGKAQRIPPLESCGRVWDLATIAKEVNDTFFNGRVKCRVGWGRSRPRRRRLRWGGGRSIRYGSWDATTRTVRVHPLLDDVRVPAAFVRYIVFHEMLHAVVPGERRGTRLLHHPRAFRVLEKQFPELDKMNRLARRLLSALV
ncbi:MAG: hypothetical protein O3B24_07610 [Verrucomicrobia bacterium]|nr:hypothetical protein [Verrucomicrobiota bacterium]